jgi:hypothetical protein
MNNTSSYLDSRFMLWPSPVWILQFVSSTQQVDNVMSATCLETLIHFILIDSR